MSRSSSTASSSIRTRPRRTRSRARPAGTITTARAAASPRAGSRSTASPPTSPTTMRRTRTRRLQPAAELQPERLYGRHVYQPATGVLGTTLFLPGTPACHAAAAPSPRAGRGRQALHRAAGAAGRRPSGPPDGRRYRRAAAAQRRHHARLLGQPEVQGRAGLELRSITAWRGVSTDQWDNSGGAGRAAPSRRTAQRFSRYSLSFLRQHQFSQEFQAVGSVAAVRLRRRRLLLQRARQRICRDPARATCGTPTAPPTRSAARSSSRQRDQRRQFGLSAVRPVVQQHAGDHRAAVRQQLPVHHPRQRGVRPQLLGVRQCDLHAGRRWTGCTSPPAAARPRTSVTARSTSSTTVRTCRLPTRVAVRLPNSISRFDPMVNVAFDATPDVHLYAKYATGFRAGGANDRSQNFNAFGPEAVKSYEIGAKMDFSIHTRPPEPRRLHHGPQTPSSTSTCSTPTRPARPTAATSSRRSNAGMSKIRGIEADLTVRPVTGPDADGFLRLHLLEGAIGGEPAAPAALPQQLYIVYTPTNAASGSIDYDVPVGNGDATRPLPPRRQLCEQPVQLPARADQDRRRASSSTAASRWPTSR